MSKEIALIENSLIFDAQFKFSLREQKVLLYLITKLDPITMDDFEDMYLTFSEIKSILISDGGKWGSMYLELNGLKKKLMSRQIHWLTDVKANNKNLVGDANWFEKVTYSENEHGENCMVFSFTNTLKPYLLELKEYVKINRLEVVLFKSAYSFRLFLIFKAHREKTRKWKPKESSLKYNLNDLRDLIYAIKEDKNGKKQYLYEKWSHFEAKILKVAKKEINEHTSLDIEYTPLKPSRKIIGVEFVIRDKNIKETIHLVEAKEVESTTKKAATPPPSKFTWAQVKAYDLLITFGVDSGIAIKQIIPTIKGTEFIGFEDYFIEEALKHFQKKSRNTKDKNTAAATFVIWWTQNKSFDVNNPTWSAILEKVIARKKELERGKTESFNNRQMAATMSEEAFKKWFRKEQKESGESVADRVAEAASKMGF